MKKKSISIVKLQQFDPDKLQRIARDTQYDVRTQTDAAALVRKYQQKAIRMRRR